ncbi:MULTISPECIES: zinc-binding alcohol dehydrogenase family protein [Pseudomonas]|jgi:zinc-binding alcohol dehydrogenase family protein|uniref:Zinc-type alcohol dehydrogenase-like protein n=1 Tax=Pseudomonas frederiksbergensis TaxID=104087 RepID=A0A0B1YZQ2_9PSED|nr:MULTISPECIES: zinc-binding alcohol dehydrogenase family protein [Pseudomonas]KHK62478.1 NADPH:quinone reductase [Pseudomonas frederiksbergensis]KJH88049.1 NADPH:quinone reductase [Pseudomonas fluorescens]MBI6617546.1 zinc-binding alcohol dehydrogenase family protein [Pseudomonas corrugata]MBI6692135.1 zinc-binding alcohol dehydrogenase family protein [Pseudomonas corrugata]WRV69136.1 zinc-binding alcohol dehydrogenase family protein [Pseudomonas frederiksbergensis]
MKAIAYYQSLPINDPQSLQDIELPEPVAGPKDLLVEVRAISVNPVDTKVRQNVQPEGGAAKVLGWDVAGVVKAVGNEVTLFKAGDKVFYAGSIARAGGNSELHVVDERIVGHMPKTLGFAEAAALPLTAITAWELLFDRLQIKESQADLGQTLLIVGAAGGVGSILTQLASQLTGLKVIGTASRPQTADWVRGLGADLVVDHSQPLSEVLKKAGQAQVTHVASLTQTDQHLDQLVEALAPQGKLALIDDPKSLDVTKLKRKSLSLHWEFMYTRSLFETVDMLEQHKLLNRVAGLIDAGTLKTTVGEHFGVINAENLRRAHALLESGKAKGKIVLEGF